MLHAGSNGARAWALLFCLALMGSPVGAAAEESQPPAEAVEHAAPSHQTAGVENWVSLSYGPGKAHRNPPFAFAIINFIVMVYLVGRFGRRPLAEYLQTRHRTVRDALREAARLRQQAQEKLDSVNGKLVHLEDEIATIKEHMAREAEEEKQRIVADARAQAEQLIQQADQQLNRELELARRKLEVEAVNAAMLAAERLIKQKLTDADRKRINEEYFSQLASSGGNP